MSGKVKCLNCGRMFDGDGVVVVPTMPPVCPPCGEGYKAMQQALEDGVRATYTSGASETLKNRGAQS